MAHPFKAHRDNRVRVALFVLFLFALAANALALTLVRYPYLQNVSETSVVIVWTTDEPGDSLVEYGLTAEYGSNATGDSATLTHVVTLEDLLPDTVYYYRVRTGSALSNGDTFKTANGSDNPNFKMVAFGDSGDCTLLFAGLAQRLLGLRINTLAPDLLIHTGDIIYPNGEQWGYDRCYFPIYRDTIKSRPLFPSPGNHDYRSPSFLMPYLENFYVPENIENPEHAKRYYSFNYGNAHFTAVDSELPDGGVANVDQRRWLEKDLAENVDAVWKFVFFHRPPYSSGDAGSSLSVRNVIAPLAEQYNVDMVFTGHDHDYERTRPILNNEASDNGVIYIVTGGGGALLSRVGSSSWTAFSGSFYHVAEVKVENQTLTLEPVEIDDRRRDHYTLVKGTLTGNVTNTRGDVVPNAALTVLLRDRPRAVMNTLADGSFYFNLAEGTYDLRAAAPGCQTLTQTGLAITGSAESSVRVVLVCP
ncbi:MAG: metallophosphoesterase [Acidobacteria bacterium]|nr:metallophosphoesterase [Acidobacteriota bacterium]MBI3655890.1 metallophosphoesterase [Acidobacteriota bacterium]